MCAAWKKKNKKNEIVCFYCTQSDILLCGIARFSRENKNKLRTFQPQKWKKIRNSQPQTKFTGSCKKKRVHCKVNWKRKACSLYCHFFKESEFDWNDCLAHIFTLFKKIVAAAVLHIYAHQTSVLPTTKYLYWISNLV